MSTEQLRNSGLTKEDQDTVAAKILKNSFEENKKYTSSIDFINLINVINYKERTDNFKNAIIHLLETEKDEEGYYLDSFSKRITYNGIKTLKRENVKTNWTVLQRSEYTKCSASFEYFFYGYCKIMTKKGYNFPEIREYQKRMMHGMENFDRLLLSIARQMGKCSHKSTHINIRKGDIYMNVTVETTHRLNEVIKFSKNKKRIHGRLDFQGLFNKNAYKDLDIEHITQEQKEKIDEILEVYNKLSFHVDFKYLHNFIKYNHEDNYVIALLNIYKKKEDDNIDIEVDMDIYKKIEEKI